MRNLQLLIVIVSLFVAVSCHRNKSEQGDAGGSTTAGSTAEGNRIQARALLEQGKEYYRNDQDEKAADAFQRALKLDGDLAEAHFRLGLAYEALGQAHEAEETYKKAVEKYKKYLDEHKDDAEGHYNLGQTYAGLHLYSEAVREYRQATRLKSDDADIYYDLGTALTRLAQYDEAAAAFSKSLEIDPENYRAQDALEEAREGVQRIKSGRKHQEDLLKKQEKEDELKNANAAGAASPSTTKSNTNSNHNRRPID
ncbi:MAG TPA: tetratricopeptide repeat protein [Pyrinomonadaceae bacterium]|nr:tetratricopeptide repeat protein [Pyrinomonadaceae bacterium]